MLSALTCGSTEAGRFRLSMFCWIAACVSLTLVPNENWATIRAMEFALVERSEASRGTLWIDCSIGLETCSLTSVAPAPGKERRR